MARREHTQHNQIDKRKQKHASMAAGRKEKSTDARRRSDHQRADRNAAPKRGENSASDEGRRANERFQMARASMQFTNSGTAAHDWGLPVAVTVETEEQLVEVLKHEAVQLVYLDEACFTEFTASIRRIHAVGKQAGLRLRRIERDFDASGRKEKNSADILKGLMQEGSAPEVLLIRNLDEAMLIETFFCEHPEWTAGIRRNIDYTVYGYNKEAIRALIELGAEGFTYPIELTFHECRKLRKNLSCADIKDHDRGIGELPFELMIYGHLPMMVSANCIQRTSARCDHGNRILQLRDRMGKDMPVRCYCKYCYNQIFNAEPLVLYDLPDEVRALQPQCVRYDFSVESAAVVRQVLSGAVPRNMTRGHFRHGIE